MGRGGAHGADLDQRIMSHVHDQPSLPPDPAGPAALGPAPATQAARPSQQGLLRVSIMANLPEVVASLGGDFGKVCRQAAEAPSVLADPDQFISYPRVGRLLAASIQSTRCQHLGLVLGSTGSLATLGLLGLMMKYAPTVAAALDVMVRHFRLQDRMAVLSLTVEGDQACLSYALDGPDAPAVEHILDGALTVGLRLLQGLCGEGFAPEEVRLARRRPADPAPWHQTFRAPVRFNAEISAIAFPTKWLALVNPHSDPALMRVLEERARQLEQEDSILFSDQVRRAIRPLLLSQKCSATSTAEFFRIGKRTLNRRLSEEGTDFRTLMDEVRFDVARHLLRSTEISLSEIALVLGYAEASAFTRAFRRWTGRSPRAWRRTTNHVALSQTGLPPH
jgi:AraC-like DNA-binding protein